jgi:hypothetical protein
MKLWIFQNVLLPVATLALKREVFTGALFWSLAILMETAAEKLPMKKVVVFL